ncbi:MAG: tRNA (5-methylaminomethyl-2-thiouridine)(34)-methyltransferase MnmD [Granulosicoccus sp.]
MLKPDDEAVRTADGSCTRFSDRYQQTYHSTHGAETEARHVYLDASGVTERLRTGKATRIMEIGFGLGLNFLLTADAALGYSAPLTYHAFDHDLPDIAVLRSTHYGSLLNHPECYEHLLRSLLTQEHQTTVHIKFSAVINLKLSLRDASTAAFDLHQSDAAYFDAVYLDPFSPDVNGECWSAHFIQKLSAVVRPGGTLTTYSAKGSVRRYLQEAGMQVTKAPGPPGKREFIIAKKDC